MIRIHSKLLMHIVAGMAIMGSVHISTACGEEVSGSERPTIGLALSGGGARGAAHIGVLRILEENRIPVDYIVGTSMGAIVGALYASGMSPDELEAVISHIDWSDAFIDRIPRRDRSFRRKRDDDLYLVKSRPGISSGGLEFPLGLLDGQKIDLLLKRHTLRVSAVRDFDELSIPFRAVAADIETGEAVVIGRGDLALAMRSSMSIPIVFAPREIDGRLLVDGGIGSNLAIDVVRQMGADIVIAVDISSPLQVREQLKSVLAVTDQLSTLLTRKNTDLQITTLTDRDVFIEPDLGDIKTASFDRAAEAVPKGYAAAEAMLEELERYSLSTEEYDEHLAARRRSNPWPVIDEVHIVNDSRLADDVIATRLHVEIGEPLDIDEFEKDLGQIYGLEIFESVYYDITKEQGKTVLTVIAREASWGPNYLQFGMAVFEDYEQPNFNLGVAYTRTLVNRWNGEWRTAIQIGQEPRAGTEFYQPISSSLRNFLHLDAWVGERAVNVFDDDGNASSKLNILSYGFGIAGGRELGTWGELRAGLLRESGTIEIQVGDPETPDYDFDTGELFLQLYVDELDDLNFPRSGGSLRVRAAAGLNELGSDTEYEQGVLNGSYAYSMDHYTGLARFMLAMTRNSDAPVQSLFRLGGFARLSGLEQDELMGQHAALLSAAFYRRFGSSILLPIYAGITVEYGNVFRDRDAIRIEDGIFAGSVFVGVDTFIGPIYIACGLADTSRQNYYLALGRTFDLIRRRPL
jgi:NTE family protein